MIVYLSVLTCIIGLVIYFAATNGKVSTVGLYMFWVGLLAFLLGGAPHLPTIVR